MTAHHLIALRVARPFNQKDAPPRQRRKDVAGQFIAAGFTMTDWNKFEFEAYGVTFSVIPGWHGHRVSPPENSERQTHATFPYGVDPNLIADWILDWPQRASDWMTEGLPEGEAAVENAPACYGLAQGEY